MSERTEPLCDSDEDINDPEEKLKPSIIAVEVDQKSRQEYIEMAQLRAFLSELDRWDNLQTIEYINQILAMTAASVSAEGLLKKLLSKLPSGYRQFTIPEFIQEFRKLSETHPQYTKEEVYVISEFLIDKDLTDLLRKYFQKHPNYEAFAEALDRVLRSNYHATVCAGNICNLIFPNVSSRRRPEDRLEISRSAFSVQYIEFLSLPNTGHFAQHVHDLCIKQYIENPEAYHSLHFAIVQSSGYGKSRMALQAGLQELNLVYGCLRPQRSTGYPPRIDSLCNYFFENWYSIKSMEMFIVACYSCAFWHCYKYKPEASAVKDQLPLNSLKGDDALFEEYWKQVLHECDCYKRHPDDWARIRKNYIRAQGAIGTKNLDNPQGNFITLYGNAFLKELVIVLDEATTLLDVHENSAFRNLQCAQRNLQSRNVVLVFIDTDGSIANFSPASDMDNFFCPEQQFQLLPPFYEILTLEAVKYTPHAKGNPVLEELAECFSIGRPIWIAYFFTTTMPITSVAIHMAVTFARRKLAFRSESKATTLPEQLLKDAVIAILSVRFGIDGVLDHSLGTRLMSAFMGTGMYIDNNHTRMVVSYPPEPILGEAACQLLYEIRDNVSRFSPSNLAGYIHTFMSCYAKKQISAGSYEKLLARFLLSLAYDKVQLKYAGLRETRFFSDPIELKPFLSMLVGKYSTRYKKRFKVDFLKIPEEFAFATVCFTSWTPLARLPSNADICQFIQECYKRRCAVMLPSDCPGADLLIPVRYVPKGESTASFSYVLVQVKNRVRLEAFRHDFAGQDLHPSTVFGANGPSSHSWPIPYVALYMEVVPDTLEALTAPKDKKFVVFSKSFPNHAMLLGFDFEFSTQETCLYDLFLLFHRHHVNSVNAEARTRVLHCISPLAYHFLPKSECSCREGCVSSHCGCAKQMLACGADCDCSHSSTCKSTKSCSNSFNSNRAVP